MIDGEIREMMRAAQDNGLLVVKAAALVPLCDELLQLRAMLTPLTPEEAQRAYDAAEPVPISEGRIAEIVAHATRERTAMSDAYSVEIVDCKGRRYITPGKALPSSTRVAEVPTVVMDELLRLRAERDAAVAAIRKHRDTPGDDRCWQDDDALYAVLPEGHTQRTALDPETMRKNCERYIECRIKGLPYQTEQERIDAAVAEERAWCVAIAARELAKGSSAADVVDAIRRGE